jgi:hypothetical protein
VRIRLKDERSGKEDDFSGAGGVKGFVDFINANKKVLHPTGLPRQWRAPGRKLRRHPRHQNRRGSGHAVERRLQRAGALLHQQHPAA